MSRIQVIAPEGMKFRIGGKPISDTNPVWVDENEYRVRKHLKDGSILRYAEVIKEVEPVKEEVPAVVPEESIKEFTDVVNASKPQRSRSARRNKRQGEER